MFKSHSILQNEVLPCSPVMFSFSGFFFLFFLILTKHLFATLNKHPSHNITYEWFSYKVYCSFSKCQNVFNTNMKLFSNVTCVVSAFYVYLLGLGSPSFSSSPWSCATLTPNAHPRTVPQPTSTSLPPHTTYPSIPHFLAHTTLYCHFFYTLTPSVPLCIGQLKKMTAGRNLVGTPSHKQQHQIWRTTPLPSPKSLKLFRALWWSMASSLSPFISNFGPTCTSLLIVLHGMDKPKWVQEEVVGVREWWESVSKSKGRWSGLVGSNKRF